MEADDENTKYTVQEQHSEKYWSEKSAEDSGNDDSEHALVISEDDKEQDAPKDFSNTASKSDKSYDLEKTDNEQKTPGIKIKSFAKIAEDSGPSREEAATPQINHPQQSSTTEQDGISDMSSECSDSELEGTPYTCGTELEMTRVNKTANGESLFQCGFCDKLFANKYHLQSHLVTHTGERAFNCKVCNKTFGRKSTLRAHMTTHTKVSNFMCGVCEKACNDNNSLEEHMRMHTGIKTKILISIIFNNFILLR